MNSVSGGPIETLDNVGKNVSKGLQQFLVGPQPIGAITMNTTTTITTIVADTNTITLSNY